ncbi:Ctf8p and Ctf18p associating protein [Coemansia spiralis]|uniref:Ctf8p and Ctf18p associating protein n=2 Tax=Coemansia TaxID=4863 RepID=A0A9W8GDD2_9FUNG|nr:sister chromatid cohesion protein Dcc1 [Coemansia spiralis]KAJ1992560.1 Ctf8p and Ctf18p associating protein [Coemansia umbellata]KAJ2623060.1 Ctf8p and Ctf18p associating protein [Coemansia sp. RSA 1358]KAJ2681106.1 Ctf8p and Ctf18p associating protein [Coemansia spiralis]
MTQEEIRSTDGSSGSWGVSASAGYPEEYRLLELTPSILAQLASTHDETALVVRGRETDTATLIDPADTAYQMTTAHTSNNLYLLAREPGRLVLRAMLNQTFELQKTRPQVRARVLEVLAWDTGGAFRGAEFERADAERTPVTDEVLQAHVQAGDAEVRRVLADIPAFRGPANCWRLIDPAYCVDLLRVVLATQVELEWPQLSAHQIHAELNEPVEVVEAVLAKFGTEARGHYTIDGTRVAKYLAEQIFAAEEMRAWPVAEFAAALHATMPPQLQYSTGDAQSVPAAVVRELAYADTHTDPGRTLLVPLFRSALPNEPRARLQRLFEARARWPRTDVQPFLEDLVDVDQQLLAAGDQHACAAASKAIDAWLLKFGRGVRCPDGETVYTSRLK